MNSPESNERERHLVSQTSLEQSTKASIDEFGKLSFLFVKYFLLLILTFFFFLLLVVGILSWHLEMEITVDGNGLVRPKILHRVKTQIDGIIKKVHIQQWDKVKSGTILIEMDDSDIAAEIIKIRREISINDSRISEIEIAIEGERNILEAELLSTTMDSLSADLHLQQLRKEYQLYNEYLKGKKRSLSLDDLMPVRIREISVSKTKIEIEKNRRRLKEIDTRRQQIQTIKQVQEKLIQEILFLENVQRKTRLEASCEGTVLTPDLHLRIGDRVQAGEIILELGDMTDWQAILYISEVDIPKIKIGQIVKLFIEAFPHMEYKIFQGIVEKIPAQPVNINSLDVSSKSLYPVKVMLLNPEIQNGKVKYSLAYGMTAEGKIVIERGHVHDLIWKKFLQKMDKLSFPDFHLKN